MHVIDYKFASNDFQDFIIWFTSDAIREDFVNTLDEVYHYKGSVLPISSILIHLHHADHSAAIFRLDPIHGDKEVEWLYQWLRVQKSNDITVDWEYAI